MCHFRAQNDPFVLNKFFFVQTIIVTFICLLALFIVQNFYKNYYSPSRVIRMHHFWAQNGPFAPNKFFFGKLLISFSSTYQPLSLCKILKHSSSGSRVMRIRSLWAQNGPFPQIRIFFRKPVNEPCFFHSCLSTCQKSKSNINRLVKC